MSSILNMFEDDFEKSFSKVEEVDQGGIATVAKKAKEIAELEAQIAQAEEFLKIAKKDLLKKTDEDLPALNAGARYSIVYFR
jgi:dihydroxyacetone kinase-like predicted kinase